MLIFWNQELLSKLLNRGAIKLSAETIAVSVLEESSSSMFSNFTRLDAPGNLYSPATGKVCAFLKTWYSAPGKQISPHHSAAQNVTSHG